MTKKPSLKPQAKECEDFGMPSSTELRQASVVSKSISKIITMDEATTKLHHKMLRHSICCRFELARHCRGCKSFREFREG